MRNKKTKRKSKSKKKTNLKNIKKRLHLKYINY